MAHPITRHRLARAAASVGALVGALAWVLVVALVVSLAAPARGAAQAGWRDLELGGGRRATRYLPRSVRTCDPLPLLVFLHGAGGTPEGYASFLEADAERLGLVLLMPQASGSGWSSADTPTLNAALDALDAELLVDDARTYLGGHSAGGAFAYMLAYGGTGVAAVFSMSAPFQPIASLAEPGYPAPIRMYYGEDDPNYTGGAAATLESQWARLGVPSELDVAPGHGHSSWPDGTIAAGFGFLLSHRHPGASPASRCGDADAGAPALTDAGAAPDAGAGPAPLDGGLVDVAQDAGSADPTPDASRGSRGPAGIGSGCACRAGAGPQGASLALLGVGWLLAVLARRRLA